MTGAATPGEADDLVSRVRASLAHVSPREVDMFGGVSFMVAGAIAVAVRRSGDLLVHIDPARRDALVDAGAAPAVMGAQRQMGPAWVTVDAALLRSQDVLDFWIRVALDRASGP